MERERKGGQNGGGTGEENELEYEGKKGGGEGSGRKK